MKIKHACTQHNPCNDCSTCNVLCCTKIQDLQVILGKDQILQGVNLHIHCGEVTAMIGPNGGGKSTFLKAMIGEVPYSGEFKFVKSNGNDFSRPIIGYVPQTLTFEKQVPMSVLDLFVASISNYPVWLPILPSLRRKVQEALSIVDAKHLIDKKIGSLSGGELQRALLALALLPMPQILLLDEPVSGIDRKGMELFYRIVDDIRNRHDLSILLVSHDLDIIRNFADRVVLLNRKVLVSGKPEDVFKHEDFVNTFGHGRMKSNGMVV